MALQKPLALFNWLELCGRIEQTSIDLNGCLVRRLGSGAPAVLSSDRGSVRDQFVRDVVEVINETRLYAEDTQTEWDCIKSSSTGKHFTVARNQSQAKKTPYHPSMRVVPNRQ
jgi:hypothetical protein